MKVEQIYTGCLAQGAYYIESGGEAAIIDPLREIQPYLDRAKHDGAVIKFIFETHFHADFVSGHLTLAEKTGAPIIFGPNANPHFKATIAVDGQSFPLGKISLTALHTPGHTLESTTYLLKDEKAKDYAIFSGDTLFLGDVGRPDLAQKSNEFTQEELAGILYESLRNKILPLGDEVIVYPAHGAGSACGKNMMKQTVDTLGNQKKMNYALRTSMTKDEFIAEVTEGLTPPPAYFPLNVKMNREGYPNIETVIKQGTKALPPDEFEAIATQTGAVMLDVRSPDEFAKGHIPNSIFIGLEGSFAPWVGELIGDVNQPILIVAPPGREQETVTRLSRVGFDYTLGCLQGGFNAWLKSGKESNCVSSVSAKQFKKINETEKAPVFDVRNEAEFETAHLSEASLMPLSDINDHLSELPVDETFYLHCAGGYRSMIAASILKSRGIHNLINVEGGFKAIRESGMSVISEKTL